MAAARLFGLLSLLVAGPRLGASQNDVLATPSDVLLLKKFPDCFHHGFQWFPDIPGTDVKVESLTQCQSLCANNITNCVHFAYWPTSGKCYFGDFSSHLIQSTTGPIAGRAICKQSSSTPSARCSTEQPNDGFPGRTFPASNLAWPSGRQPWSLECWPMHWTGGYAPCADTTVLEDTRQGWPGKCRGLIHQDNVSAKQCPTDCMQNPLCPAYQIDDKAQCWQGVGSDCFVRENFHPVAAQRLQHGLVRPLMNLTGWQIAGLAKVFDNWSGYFLKDSDAIKFCKNTCYSDIRCQYWQYTPKFGCWVEDASEDFAPLYPLTLDFAYRNTPFALDCVAGELIQHYCPASQTTAYPTQEPAMSSCMRQGVRYKPNLMLRFRSYELSAENCQARCARTSTCSYFAYWPDTSCYIQGKSAKPVTAEDSQVISGPPSCVAGSDSAFDFDNDAVQALHPGGATPSSLPVSSPPGAEAPPPAMAAPVVASVPPPPEYLAEIRYTIHNLDYHKVTAAERPVLEGKYLQALASAVGVDANEFSDMPRGAPGKLLLVGWLGSSTALTAFVPNIPPASSNVDRIRGLVTSKETLASLVQATNDALGTNNAAILGELQVASPRVEPLHPDTEKAEVVTCDWWCRWWPVVAAMVLLVFVGVAGFYVFCKEEEVKKKGGQRQRAASKPTSNEDSEEEWGGDDSVWADEPEWDEGRGAEVSPEKLQRQLHAP